MSLNIERKSAGFAFFVAIGFLLFFPMFFPSWKLTFFAPFLVIIYYQKTFLKCLWWSLFCGLILDLLVSDTPLGFYAIAYTLTTVLLFHQRRHFFADSLLTLPLMTFLFAILNIFFQLGLVYLFHKSPSLSWQWVLIDLFLMSLLDAAYALILFVIPTLFLKGRQSQLA